MPAKHVQQPAALFVTRHPPDRTSTDGAAEDRSARRGEQRWQHSHQGIVHQRGQLGSIELHGERGSQ